ncbi:hypothetical protein HUJ05_005620 [Dendroctonus ponderosae]|nr:hypothetical protein HUJ05_005620 [Dendroctonus ponderosae]
MQTEQKDIEEWNRFRLGTSLAQPHKRPWFFSGGQNSPFSPFSVCDAILGPFPLVKSFNKEYKQIDKSRRAAPSRRRGVWTFWQEASGLDLSCETAEEDYVVLSLVRFGFHYRNAASLSLLTVGVPKVSNK